MKKILIANRGEIARRVIHTAHRMDIETVAVYSDPDANALHVREATQAVALGGAASADTYLRTDKLLAAARATGADAVHPGYGFLSENADFAQAVIDAGLSWIGPPPGAIRALGSKAGAKALAQSHGVPCLPGYAGDDQSDERFAAEAASIGTPLMVKAVAGGGGGGMPPSNKSTIEAPPPPAGAAARGGGGGAGAGARAHAAGYVGAGTVEFLLDGAEFFLMEMNTRLQVEHPVTEALTGLDLVEWQIRVARGEPLPLTQDQMHLQGHAIEVRLCAEDAHFRPHTGRVLQFSAPPATAFERAAPGALRFDHALEEGAEVTPHYDAMLGKLIVHAPTRPEAIAALVRALQGTRVLGLPTNRAFLAACLQHPVFGAGHALVPFLAEHATQLQDLLSNEELKVLIQSAVTAVFASSSSGAVPAQLPCALARPLRLRHQGQVVPLAVRELGAGRLLVEHAGGTTHLQLAPQAAGMVRITTTQTGAEGDVRHADHTVRAVPAGSLRWHWQTGGVDGWVEDASWEPAARAGAAGGATELRAPFNGKVVALPVAAGQALAAGDTVVVIESMKLEHSLASPAAATVAELLVAPGQQVSPGQVLARFAPATQGAPA